MVYSGAWGETIKPEVEISWHCPFKTKIEIWRLFKLSRPYIICTVRNSIMARFQLYENHRVNGTFINPRVVFAFPRQRWSSITVSSLLTLFVWTSSQLLLFPYFNNTFNFRVLPIRSPDPDPHWPNMLDPDPHWPIMLDQDPQWPNMLDSEPHWNHNIDIYFWSLLRWSCTTLRSRRCPGPSTTSRRRSLSSRRRGFSGALSVLPTRGVFLHF